jgi:hypothetical protein
MEMSVMDKKYSWEVPTYSTDALERQPPERASRPGDNRCMKAVPIYAKNEKNEKGNTLSPAEMVCLQ